MDIKEGDCLFDALPIEVLEIIFVYCGNDAKHIARLEQVSKKFKQYCWRCQPSLNLQPYRTKINALVIGKLLKVTNHGELKYLSLNRCVNISRDNFPALYHLSTLEHLDLANNEAVDDNLFINSWNMPKLLSLNLRNTGVSSIGLMGLKKLTRLNSLNVYHCYNVSTLKIASYLTTLKSLDCGFCDSMSIMSGIRDVTNLHQLEVLKCQFYFFDNACGLLTALLHLTRIDVSQSSMFTKRGAASLTKVSGLKSLNVSWCDRLDDDGVQLLTALTNLEELNVSYCRLLTNSALGAIGKLTKLTRLDISGIIQLTDDGANQLRALMGLREFNIDMCHNITPAGKVEYRKMIVRHPGPLKISTDSIDVD